MEFPKTQLWGGLGEGMGHDSQYMVGDQGVRPSSRTLLSDGHYQNESGLPDPIKL